MSNYEYIIASLPYLTQDYKYDQGQGFQAVVEEIRGNLNEKDQAAMDFLLRGFDPAQLDAGFYQEALRQSCRFLREYFRFDLNLRNAKVRFLNRELGRSEEQDVVGWEEQEEAEFEEARKVDDALSQRDLLSREQALDDVVWEKADSLGTFHYFDLTAVLSYLTKLHIVDRWLALDQEKGRELFIQLVNEVRGTFKGVKYQA